MASKCFILSTFLAYNVSRPTPDEIIKNNLHPGQEPDRADQKQAQLIQIGWEKGKSQAMLAVNRDEKQAVMVFRGSATAGDAIADVQTGGCPADVAFEVR